MPHNRNGYDKGMWTLYGKELTYRYMDTILYHYLIFQKIPYSLGVMTPRSKKYSFCTKLSDGYVFNCSLSKRDRLI